jgi:lipoprotein-anchoring transpeptidase ErfK/SrfK
MSLLVYQSDLILPGVSAGGVYLGAMTRTEAAAAARQAWPSPVIEVTVGDTSRFVRAETLGFVLDSEAVAQTAYAESRSVDRLQAVLAGQLAVGVEPIWRINRDRALRFLQTLADETEIAPQDAGLEIVKGRVESTPPVAGRTLDLASSLVALSENMGHVMEVERFVPVTVTVEPTVTEVDVALAQANELVDHTLTFRGYDPIRDETVLWEATPAVWTTWLQTSIEPVSGLLDWQVDTGLAQDYLTRQAEALAPERYVALPESIAGMLGAIEGGSWQVDLRIYHHIRQHTVEPGDTLAGIGREYGIPYPWLDQANPWAGGGLAVGQVLTIPSPDELLPLPIVHGKRVVVSISQQRMWVYENGALRWEWFVSTGIESSPTHPGVFQIQSHEANAYAASWDLWMPHFMGIYRPVPTVGFMNGFHGFPSRGGTQLLWTGNLGRPVTYGCILLHSDNAAALYQWAEEGTVVQVDP